MLNKQYIIFLLFIDHLSVLKSDFDCPTNEREEIR